MLKNVIEKLGQIDSRNIIGSYYRAGQQVQCDNCGYIGGVEEFSSDPSQDVFTCPNCNYTANESYFDLVD